MSQVQLQCVYFSYIHTYTHTQTSITREMKFPVDKVLTTVLSTFPLNVNLLLVLVYDKCDSNVASGKYEGSLSR